MSTEILMAYEIMDTSEFRCSPTNFEDGSEPQIPTWSRVFNHVGTNLDKILKFHSWGEKYAVTTGGEYLAMWLALGIRLPSSRLPDLLLWGPSSIGKTTFQDAIDSLFVEREEDFLFTDNPVRTEPAVSEIEVPPLEVKNRIPAKGPGGLRDLLAKETPDFLGFLMAIDLPDIYNGLHVPVLCTKEVNSAW